MTKDDAMRLNEMVSEAYMKLDDIMYDLTALQNEAGTDEEYDELESQINAIELAIDNLPTFEGDE